MSNFSAKKIDYLQYHFHVERCSNSVNGFVIKSGYLRFLLVERSIPHRFFFWSFHFLLRKLLMHPGMEETVAWHIVHRVFADFGNHAFGQFACTCLPHEHCVQTFVWVYSIRAACIEHFVPLENHRTILTLIVCYANLSKTFWLRKLFRIQR